MTIDERLEKLTERHEALAGTVELLTNDVRELTKRMEDTAIRIEAQRHEEIRHRLAIIHAIHAYMESLGIEQ